MHGALFLPEIVSSILHSESSYPGFLYQCLVVNKLFSYEASRILWEACGSEYGPIAYGHVTPNVRHLAGLVEIDTSRAQVYANFIRDLSFSEEDHLEDSEYHNKIQLLRFPCLKTVSFSNYGEKSGSNYTEEMTSTYIQPSLTSFSIYGGNKLTDNLLQNLVSSRLRSLFLNDLRNCTISKQGLVDFLRQMNTLKDVGITKMDQCWSQEAYETLSKFPNLEFLIIPFVEDTWTLESGQFPRLTSLETTISESALIYLSNVVPNLDSLSVNPRINHQPSGIFQSASKFAKLTSFSINFAHQSSFNSHCLIDLANACPDLETLEIEGLEVDPSAVGMSDDIIERMAQKMPKMTRFDLFIAEPERISWKSVTALANYCPKLGSLRFSCNFTWEEALENSQADMFPNLRYLSFYCDDAARQTIAEDRIEVIASNFVTRVPNLKYFHVLSGNTSDRKIVHAVRKHLGADERTVY